MFDDNIVKVNFAQFENDFTGLGVEDEMPFQGTSTSFGYSMFAQTLVKCFQICRHNVIQVLCPSVAWD